MTAATRRCRRLPVPAPSPGSSAELTVLCYGREGGRPKAYLQASLHADEIPGMLVLNHLVQRLDAVAEQVQGEIVIVPVANPLGLCQHVGGRLLGRHALTGAGNYNRGFADLRAPAAERLAGRLGDDAAANVALIRQALRACLADVVATDETQWLRRTLLGLALDADIVLDLHCDSEALLHVYLGTPLWPEAADLSAQLESHATLLATVSGGHPFDEAVAGPWWGLADDFPAAAVPAACLAATVELRGLADVDDRRAALDADSLLRFLQRRRVVAGDPGPLPTPRCEASALEAVDVVRAPTHGVLGWLAPVGARVSAGEAVATLAQPLALDRPGARTTLASATDGLLFARTDARFLRAGEVVCKVAGHRPLAHRRAGALLTD